MAFEGASIYKYEKETFQYAALISNSRLANSNPYPVLLRRTAVTQQKHRISTSCSRNDNTKKRKQLVSKVIKTILKIWESWKSALETLAYCSLWIPSIPCSPKVHLVFSFYSISPPDFRVRRVKAESTIEPRKRVFSILMVVQILSSFKFIALLATRY